MFDARNKSRTLGYNTIITDNGLIKEKIINENKDHNWVKIANRNDVDKLKSGNLFKFSFNKAKAGRRAKLTLCSA